MFQASIIIRSHGSDPSEWNIWVEFECARDNVLRVYSQIPQLMTAQKCINGNPNVSSYNRARYSEDVAVRNEYEK